MRMQQEIDMVIPLWGILSVLGISIIFIIKLYIRHLQLDVNITKLESKVDYLESKHLDSKEEYHELKQLIIKLETKLDIFLKTNNKSY